MLYQLFCICLGEGEVHFSWAGASGQRNHRILLLLSLISRWFSLLPTILAVSTWRPFKGFGCRSFFVPLVSEVCLFWGDSFWPCTNPSLIDIRPLSLRTSSFLVWIWTGSQYRCEVLQPFFFVFYCLLYDLIQNDAAGCAGDHLIGLWSFFWACASFAILRTNASLSFPLFRILSRRFHML